MIISTDAEKSSNKIQHPLVIKKKIPLERGHKGNISHHNEDFLKYITKFLFSGESANFIPISSSDFVSTVMREIGPHFPSLSFKTLCQFED